jgi:hypothetical protein
MARTVPSVIGTSKVLPVRLSVTVSVSAAWATPAPPSCCVSVLIGWVSPEAVGSEARTLARACVQAPYPETMEAATAASTSSAEIPMIPRAAPSAGKSGRDSP